MTKYAAKPTAAAVRTPSTASTGQASERPREEVPATSTESAGTAPAAGVAVVVVRAVPGTGGPGTAAAGAGASSPVSAELSAFSEDPFVMETAGFSAFGASPAGASFVAP